MQTTYTRIEAPADDSERAKINLLTPAERKQALLRAAEEKAKRVFSETRE